MPRYSAHIVETNETVAIKKAGQFHGASPAAGKVLALGSIGDVMNLKNCQNQNG